MENKNVESKALPSSGAISASQIADELKIPHSNVNLNDSRLRSLAGRPSGTISFSDFHGKANSIADLTMYVGILPGFDTNYVGYYEHGGQGSINPRYSFIQEISVKPVGNGELCILEFEHGSEPNIYYQKTIQITFTYGSSTLTENCYMGKWNGSDGSYAFELNRSYRHWANILVNGRTVHVTMRVV